MTEWQSISVEEAALGRIHGAIVGVLALVGSLPFSLAAQGQVADQLAVDAYHGIVSKAFSVSVDEVGILAEWSLQPDEIAVVLFAARRAGISPDALASLRTSGLSWTTILQTYSVGASALWLSFPEGTSLGPLEETYRAFSEMPRNSWNSIDLPDEAVIALVNLRILASEMEIPLTRVLDVWGGEGDFVAVHRRLTG